MTLKVGADGHTQPAAKGAGVMILVEKMIGPAFQAFVEGTRFANMVALSILSPPSSSDVANDAVAVPLLLRSPCHRPPKLEITQTFVRRCFARCWSERGGDHEDTRPDESAYLDWVFNAKYRRPGVPVPPLASCPRGQ